MTTSASNEKRTALLLRWVGYTLLLLALFDVIEIFIPPNFMNPGWDFQTMGRLVEHVIAPLLGLILVFYGETNFRAEWEIVLLKVLSWVSLVVGLLYLLLIPWGLSSTFRLYSSGGSQIDAQANQRLAQIQQFREQLNKASDKDVEQLVTRLNQGRAPDLKNQDLGKIKSQLSEYSNRAEQKLKADAKAAQDNQRLTLLKNAFKWILGALVSGISFVYVWRLTRWARKYSEY